MGGVVRWGCRPIELEDDGRAPHGPVRSQLRRAQCTQHRRNHKSMSATNRHTAQIPTPLLRAPPKEHLLQPEHVHQWGEVRVRHNLCTRPLSGRGRRSEPRQLGGGQGRWGCMDHWRRSATLWSVLWPSCPSPLLRFGIRLRCTGLTMGWTEQRRDEVRKGPAEDVAKGQGGVPWARVCVCLGCVLGPG